MLPKVNRTLYMTQTLEAQEPAELYKSRIAEIEPDYISIEIPISEKTGKFKQLFEGEELISFYMDNTGVKYFFKTVVLGFKEDVIPLVMIKPPDLKKIVKHPNRKYLRVRAELEVALQMGDKVHFLALTQDIGGGGLAVVCEEHIPLQEQDNLSGWVVLPFRSGLIEHVPFEAEIVQIEPQEKRKKLLKMRFSEINERERQKVIQYCYERQREYLKA